jgi:hypothetical protein
MMHGRAHIQCQQCAVPANDCEVPPALNACKLPLILLLLLFSCAVGISSLSKDIVLLIKEDHDRVRSLYDQVRSS